MHVSLFDPLQLEFRGKRKKMLLNREHTAVDSLQVRGL
jgi:hypothetical protein